MEGTRHIPSTRTSCAPDLRQALSGAGCQRHKDESGFCVSGRRHRVHWDPSLLSETGSCLLLKFRAGADILELLFLE